MNADSISPGTCSTVYHNVLNPDRPNCGSVNTTLKLSTPANDRVPNPSQFENARTTAKTSGPSMNTSEADQLRPQEQVGGQSIPAVPTPTATAGRLPRRRSAAPTLGVCRPG